ncbi:hypothetical protein QQS21_003076 [Conoideocrella luteorostrata]|uniref:Uncharacterized protein n=1 Tax=Conoideocrella luteorostrata TaxID=1105319 RepID=A0AAJ0G0S0_9HYPO|nr:hypothetical protein QQS21_003076 [Conoideocrella luteorostrata]
MFHRMNSLNWLRQLRRRHPLLFRTLGHRHESSQASRIDRITNRLPRRLQKYTSGLRNAPVSHVVSFLILHEMTAIVPLFALFALFHYTTFVPVAYMTSHFGDYVQSGISRFEKYFSRKGWFGFGPGDAEKDSTHGTNIIDKWDGEEQKYRILVEVALAYAVTKVLLPIRIIGSVWATPWFAGVLVRTRKALTRKS